MNIVIMGPQGSGKSTQAEILASNLAVPHISTGDIFRRIKEESAGSELSRRVKDRLEKGLLVEDVDALGVVDERLSKDDCKGGFVLDGAPRDIFQAESMKAVIHKVFYVMVSDPVCVKRLVLRGREDDTEELINVRLAEYHKQTESVLGFYRSQNKLIEVNGEAKIGEIAEEILEKVKN
ncbi:adenylate kinase [candidate division WWE3 bacterium CG08_land_8_20_14_0_20_40_13]|uniref:Adenylate kinase n=1 Tax=candidate division WWE3 bacterium CG08_land_8_20_14_0_20_40_13 TaxID=1975084 RepID=A0A2H0XEM6_UNCKA|nr:MAG: adenylate kinase [candidate division WWE3 bacterium CG08_land_8_20_14_0_20_40_13]